jgi:hypothetical protein
MQIEFSNVDFNDTVTITNSLKKTNITASRIAVLDSAKNITNGIQTTEELEYIKNLNSNFTPIYSNKLKIYDSSGNPIPNVKILYERVIPNTSGSYTVNFIESFNIPPRVFITNNRFFLNSIVYLTSVTNNSATVVMVNANGAVELFPFYLIAIGT